MEMHQIRYFLNTCETSNFTRAAELSHVSQPALTKAIRMLEEELGAPLFDRQVRPLQLTELGRTLYDRFSKIWDLTLEIKQTSKHYTGLLRAMFALGVVNTIGEHRLMALVDRLEKNLPGVAIAVRYVAQDKLLKDLRDGVLEMALLADCPQIDSRYDSTALLEDRYVVISNHDHPFAKRENVGLEDLQGQDYVVREHCEKNDEIEAMLRKRGIEPKHRLFSDQDDYVQRMIERGYGITVLPEPLVQGHMTKRPLVDPTISRTIVLSSPSNRRLSAVAEGVREQILEMSWDAT